MNLKAMTMKKGLIQLGFRLQSQMLAPDAKNRLRPKP